MRDGESALDDVKSGAARIEDVAPEWMAGPEDEIASLIVLLAAQLVSHMRGQVAREGVTEPQALLIRQLRQPLPMRTVASRMHCDPSNLTGIVDRLESRGLLERRTQLADRRIKELGLTATGKKLQRRLDAISTASPGLSELSAVEQKTLIGLLRQTLRSLKLADQPESATAERLDDPSEGA